ncbi:MAG: D-alanine--D-alanine ligase [Phycisphaerales bacterium]|nr:D-alanine--D-alanine ligase [Planctomycetota bacterium]
MKRQVLVLGGGPDAEREVSLVSSKFVSQALERSGDFDVCYQVVERPDLAQLRGLPGDVVFPVLHGGWGEGGALQDLLDLDGRPYVGCPASAARIAMDKVATKLIAAQLGIPTQPATVFNAGDPVSCFPMPVVLKPVQEGSSVGVHICRSAEDFKEAARKVQEDIKKHPNRVYMIERAVLGGSELTVGVLDGKPLPPIEIKPTVAFYDYEAKYHRNDTKYTVDPTLPAGVGARISEFAARLFAGIGARHLARVDFLLDREGGVWLLEVNTMPGFTDHSLFPMAANRQGLPMEKLCAKLVELALRDAKRP